MKKYINKIYISESASNDLTTKEILKQHPGSLHFVIPDEYNLAKEIKGEDPKKILFLTHSKGQIIKDCPGTAESYLCCRYQVINQTQNCPLNCTYCILQFYLNQPATIIYTDFDSVFEELKKKLKSNPKRFNRIGTGELADSLALPGSRLFAKRAIRFFYDIPNALFELKTKTVEIESLLSIPHNEHTVLSWSLNPTEIIKREEHLAASLKSRLSAASKAEKAGFLLGFHFDPIICCPNWENLYCELVNDLYSSIDTSRIAWISLGSLRFPASMKDKIIERYPESNLVYGEMIEGMDGKLRYARPVRIPMYHLVYQKLINIENPPFIYFCMESPDVWKEVMGFSPSSNAHLDYMFAESVHNRFNHIITDKPILKDYDRGFTMSKVTKVN